MLLLLRVVAIRHHSEQPSMMNTLNKSLIIATLIISTFISGINVDLDDGFFLFDKIRRQ
jgi:hypothetical protein